MAKTSKKKSSEIALEVIQSMQDNDSFDLDDLKNLKKEEMGEIVFAMAKMTKSHRGPLPPSEDFINYEKAHPGAAGRILSYAEDEQKHRHKMDEKLVQAAVDDTARGQRYALITMIFLIACALISVLMGLDVIASVFLAPVVLGIVGKFIDGRRRHQTD